jgi:hypothetical protein
MTGRKRVRSVGIIVASFGARRYVAPVPGAKPWVSQSRSAVTYLRQLAQRNQTLDISIPMRLPSRASASISQTKASLASPRLEARTNGARCDRYDARYCRHGVALNTRNCQRANHVPAKSCAQVIKNRAVVFSAQYS